MIFAVNQSGAIYGPTAGISRNMQGATSPVPTDTPGQQQGGGNLNGTQATSILFSHAGTAAQRIAVPRTVAGNYCGVV